MKKLKLGIWKKMSLYTQRISSEWVQREKMKW